MNSTERQERRIQSIQKKQISVLQRRLLTWYGKKGRSFPWRRKSTTNYKLVITEILLQRTRAETVAGFFDTFFSRYPSWKNMAAAEETEIGRIIKPIGLWKRRATTLKKLATVMAKRNGRFPRNRAELEALPGIGQYIANAILLLCHGEAQPLLDANMARVLERVFGPRKLADIRYDPFLQELALKVVQCKKARMINWAILDLAATVCLLKNPRCNDCPLRSICLMIASN